jgi:hypothetical protein
MTGEREPAGDEEEGQGKQDKDEEREEGGLLYAD